MNLAAEDAAAFKLWLQTAPKEIVNHDKYTTLLHSAANNNKLDLITIFLNR